MTLLEEAWLNEPVFLTLAHSYVILYRTCHLFGRFQGEKFYMNIYFISEVRVFNLQFFSEFETLSCCD